MTPVQIALWSIAIALYAGQAAVAVFPFLRPARPAEDRLPYLALGALAFHAGFLITRAMQVQGLPIETRLDSVALFLWLTAAVFVAAEGPLRLSGIAVVFWPLFALCAIGMGILSGRAPMDRPTLGKTWLLLHLIPVYIGYAGFAVATGAAVTRLIQQQLLRGKRPEALWERLPSLARLDQIGRIAVAWGFPLFTVGLAAGAIWAERNSGLLGRAWYGDAKVIAGFAGWLIYAAVVHMRLAGKMSANRAAIFTIAGFLVALATFGVAHAYPGRTPPFSAPPGISSKT
jgi:ABC-type transport system involved in cytochrome c biogenesis permease subunit